MPRILGGALLTLLAILARPPEAPAWQTVLDPSIGAAQLVAFDRARNVIAAGRTRISGDDSLLTVVKLNRRGEPRWLTGIAPQASRLSALGVDAAGDVFVAGAVGGSDEDSFGRFVVVKLGGASGDERWRQELPGDGFANDLVLDPAGDVVAGGYVTRTCGCDVECYPCAVGITLKLASQTGAELWRREAGPYQVDALAMRADGDVVGADLAGAWRLTGATGAVVWESALSQEPGLVLVTVDPAGNMLRAGRQSVVKLAGETGVSSWNATIAGLEGVFGRSTDRTADGAGDVVVGAAAAGEGLDTDAAVVKLAGSDGRERWRYTVAEPEPTSAGAIASDAAGDVIVSMSWQDRTTSRLRGRVAKLAGTSGTPRWQREPDGLGCGATVGGLAVGTRGGVAIAGSLCTEFQFDHHFAVFRLSRGSGLGLRPLRVR